MELRELEDIVKLETVLKKSNPSGIQKDIDNVIECATACDKTTSLLDVLHEKVNKLLDDCRRKREAIWERIETCQKKQNIRVSSNIMRRNHYFQDHNGYRPPPNEDEKTLDYLQLPNYIGLRPAWSWNKNQKRQVFEAVMRQSREKGSESVTPLDSDVDPYDWNRVASECSGTRNPTECRAIWYLFVHPSINKKPWSAGEVQQLCSIAEKFGHQDWDKIASTLGTGRTSYQCFVYHKMFLSRDTSRGVKWSTQEDLQLFNLIESCRVGDHISWSKVAFHMENRSKEQIYNRYLYLFKNHGRNTRFSKEEIEVIDAAVQVYGKHFKKIAKLLPGRHYCDIYRCYCAHIFNNNPKNWTLDEDCLLLGLTSSGHFRPHEMRRSFPGKNLFNVRKRYVFLTKWQTRHPGKSITLIPRKKVVKLTKAKAKDYLARALKKYCDALETSTLPKKKGPVLQIKKPNLRSVDRELIRYFEQYEDFTIKTPGDTVNVPAADVNISDLKAILFLLGAKLDLNLLRTIKSKRLSLHLEDLMNKLRSEQTDVNVKSSAVRTYSRKKKPVEPVSCDNSVKNQLSFEDICLNSPKGHFLRYCFPPSFYTIHTLRSMTLLKYRICYSVSRRFDEESIDGGVSEKLFSFILRFEALFRWPLLLSSVIPNKQLMSTIEDKSSLEASNDSIIDSWSSSKRSESSNTNKRPSIDSVQENPKRLKQTVNA